MPRTATTNSVRKRFEEGKPVTRQMVFEAVSKHLFKQGKRSAMHLPGRGDVPKCVYRGKDGSSCAIGCIMPDSFYLKWMDTDTSTGVDSIVAYAALQKKFTKKPPTTASARFYLWLESDEEFATSFQSLHDAHEHWENDAAMKYQLNKFARLYKLDASVIDGLHFRKNRET
jgi:hypothetical protein